MKRYILLLTLVSCTAFSNHQLIGTYDLDVLISNKKYKDILIIESLETDGTLLGEFQVPGAFRAPFSGRIVKGRVLGDFYPVENGAKFHVLLKGDFKNVCRVRGELIQKGERFAVFTGHQRGCDE